MSDVEEESAEKRLKIVLIGDSGAGKVSSRRRSSSSLEDAATADTEVVDPQFRALETQRLFISAHLSV